MAAVVGDVNLDVLAVLNGEHLGGGDDVFALAPMTVGAGGTATGFAQAAVEHFASVHVFARIGHDPVAGVLAAELGGMGAVAHLTRDRRAPSRIVVVLREPPNGRGPGRRIMVPRAGVANDRLADGDLADLFALDRLDVVLFDGYSLLLEPSAATVKRAAARLRAAGVPVALDLVPHDLHKRWSMRDLIEATADARIVISEAPTLLELIGLPSTGIDAGALVARLPAIREVLGVRVLLLRFGIGQIDESLLVWPDGTWRHRFTGYADATDATGFGDRLTAAELIEVLEVLTR